MSQGLWQLISSHLPAGLLSLVLSRGWASEVMVSPSNPVSDGFPQEGWSLGHPGGQP